MVTPGEILVQGQHIVEVGSTVKHPAGAQMVDLGDTTLLPGLIDAHVHFERSMLVPREFALAAVVHGTVATVSDPH